MAVTDAVLAVARIRAAESRTMASVPEHVLMDRAAEAVAAACRGLLTQPSPRIVVLAGSGNNGGDALLAGALLAHEGATVTAIQTGAVLHERGAQRLTHSGGTAIAANDAAASQALDQADLVIDGIAGIGSRPGLRDDAAALVARIVAPVVAVDLPSGLDADSSTADAPHVTATATVTFTAYKRCLVQDPAAASCGDVILADVGIDL